MFIRILLSEAGNVSGLELLDTDLNVVHNVVYGRLVAIDRFEGSGGEDIYDWAVEQMSLHYGVEVINGGNGSYYSDSGNSILFEVELSIF